MSQSSDSFTELSQKWYILMKNCYVRRWEMPIIYKLLIVFAYICLLAGCQQEEYEPIAEKANVAATINIKDMSVTFIDIDKQEKMAQWTLEKPYTGGVIFPDGDTFLLYGKDIDTIDLFSLSKGTMIDHWDVGEGIVNGLLINKDELAFADENQDSIRFFDLSGSEHATVDTEANPYTMTLSEKEGLLYVLSFDHEELTKIDANKKERLEGFTINPFASGALLLEEQNELWVGGHGEGIDIEKNVHVYGTKSGELKTKISVPTMPVDFVQKDDWIYIVSHGSNTLYKVDKEGQVADSVTVTANPFNIELAGEELLVAGYDSSDIQFINEDTLTVDKRVKVGEGPFQIVLREK